jgi:hypothetical protein
MPSFESLRSTVRHSAVDLLVPGPAPTAPPEPAPPASPVPPVPPAGAGRPEPRPAEYGDLLRLGLRAVRAVARLPGCVLQRLRTGLGG